MNIKISTKLVSGIIIAIVIAAVFVNFYVNPNGMTSQNTKVRIGYMPITGDYQFFIAMEKNLFKKQGIEIEAVKFASSNQMIEALTLDKIDVIASAAAPTAYIFESKSPGGIKIFAYTDDNNLPAIIVSANSTITNASQLSGKKIGTFPGTTAQTALKSMLERYGINPKSVKIIELTPPLQLGAIASGQVDA